MAEPVTIDGIKYDRYGGFWDQDVPTLIGTYGGGVFGPVGATIADAVWRIAKIGPRWVIVTPQHKVWWMKGLYKAFLTTNHPDNLGIWQSGANPGTAYSYTPPGAPNKIPFPNAASYGALARYQVRTPTQNPKWEMYCHESRRLRSWHINCLGEDAVFEAKAGNAAVAASTVYNAASFPSSGGAGKNWWGGDHVANSSGQWSNPEGHVYYHFTQGGLYAGGKPVVAGNDPVKIVYQHLPSYMPAALTGAGSTAAAAGRIFMDVFDPQFLAHCLAYGAITTGSDMAAFVQVDDGDYCYGLGHGHKNETGFVNMSSDADTRVPPHLGFLFLVANPFPTTQAKTIPGSNGTAIPVSFQTKNQKMFTKLFIRDMLFTKYNGSIAALNSAWGSNYTTFDSAGGWKTGTGLLDEDGRTSHTWLGNGTEAAKDARWIDSTKWNPGVKVDLDNALYEITKKYFSDIRQGVTRNGTLKKMYAGHSYIVTWGYPCRKPVLKACAEILDILPSAQANEPEAVYEYLAQFAGTDKPFINWMLAVSRADSSMYYLGASGSSTQAGRATSGFVNPNNRAIQFKNAKYGTYQYVGYHWFEMYDKRSESGAWGFCGRRWNPYDGRDYASAHKLPDSLPGVAGSVYPTLAEDGPAYAATDPGLAYKVYGDFITPVKQWHIGLPGVLAAQFSGAPPPNDTTPPTIPGTLVAELGSATIRLSWTAATDNVAVTEYRISRKPSAGGAYVQVGTTAQLFFQDAGLAQSTSYDYSVVAADAANNVGPTRTGTFVTVAQTLTRVTENFNGPDNPVNVGVQQLWTSLFSGTGFGVTGQQARLQGIPGAQPATNRLEVDSTNVAQFIEADLARQTGAGAMAGLCLRMTSSAVDRYVAQVVTPSADLLTPARVIIRKEQAGGGGSASAAPVVSGRTDGHTSAVTTSLTVNLPPPAAGSGVGDLLLVMLGYRSLTAMTWPTGWQAPTGGARNSGVIRGEVRWKIADGTEGASMAVTGASAQWTYRVWRITGHDGTGIAIAGGQGNTANPDPPNLGVPWGTKPTLWITSVVRDNKGVLPSAYPATYTDAQHYGENGGSSLWTCHAAAEKTASAPSDDPGAWTWAADEWVEYTMAVGPISGPVAPLVTVDRAVAVGSRLRFEADAPAAGQVGLRLYDDGVLVAAATDTGSGVLAGKRGGITGSQAASTDEVAFENVTFGDIDQTTATPSPPVVTIRTITSPVSDVIDVTADFTDPNAVGGVRSELYVDGVLDSVREPLSGLVTTHQWNTLASSDGVHILRVDVIDGTGTRGQSSNTSVTIANRATRRVQVSEASLTVPDPAVTTRRVQVSQASLTVPDKPVTTPNTWFQPVKWRRDPNATSYHVYLDDVDLGEVPQPAEGEQPQYTFTFQGPDVEVIFGFASVLPGPVLSRRNSVRRRYRQAPVTDLAGPAGIELPPPTFTA